MLDQYQLFDSHFHIIDARYPLVRNQGYLPEVFTVQNYKDRMLEYDLCGGVVVSGSFQAFDQTYLVASLKELGSSYVGVAQIPASMSDEELGYLNDSGVRAVRFNVKRGGSEGIGELAYLADKVHDLFGWHAELYIDSSNLAGLYETIINLPAVSVDHLGLSKSGLSTLLKLAGKVVRIKATGFGRVDFDIAEVLKSIYSENPDALMFGTDLPSTRAPVPYTDEDFLCISDILGDVGAAKVFSGNAMDFYRLSMRKNAGVKL